MSKSKNDDTTKYIRLKKLINGIDIDNKSASKSSHKEGFQSRSKAIDHHAEMWCNASTKNVVEYNPFCNAEIKTTQQKVNTLDSLRKECYNNSR